MNGARKSEIDLAAVRCIKRAGTCNPPPLAPLASSGKRTKDKSNSFPPFLPNRGDAKGLRAAVAAWRHHRPRGSRASCPSIPDGTPFRGQRWWGPFLSLDPAGRKLLATTQRMVSAPRLVAVDYRSVHQASGDPNQFDERVLAEKARTDADAFAQLYRHYLPRIYAFAYRRTHAKDLAEDITASTFERAYRTLEHFEWRGGGFGAWLFRIASNELADHYRRQGRSQSDRGQAALGQLHAAFSVDDLDRVESGDHATQALLAALDTIHPRYQEAISLRYLSGLSHEEAAAAMGISKPVMAVTLSRALKGLKKAMEKLAAEAEEAS